MTDACPCCGQPLPESRDPRARVPHIYFSPLELRLLDRLFRSFGSYVSREGVVAWSYAHHSNGGPTWADTAISVRVVGLRKKLALSDLILESRMGAGGGYRLNWRQPQLRVAA